MSAKPTKLPGPDHPISIEPNKAQVVISVGGHVIADSRRALSLREANYPVVQYVPREDADMTLLKRSAHTTYCPYKGDCVYFSIPIGGDRSTDAVWSYEAPHPAVAQIAGYLAFYPERVDKIEQRTDGR